MHIILQESIIERHSAETIKFLTNEEKLTKESMKDQLYNRNRLNELEKERNEARQKGIKNTIQEFKKWRAVNKGICNFMDRPGNVIAFIKYCGILFGYAYAQSAEQFDWNRAAEYNKVNLIETDPYFIIKSRYNEETTYKERVRLLVNHPLFDPHFSWSPEVPTRHTPCPITDRLNYLCATHYFIKNENCTKKQDLIEGTTLLLDALLKKKGFELNKPIINPLINIKISDKYQLLIGGPLFSTLHDRTLCKLFIEKGAAINSPNYEKHPPLEELFLRDNSLNYQNCLTIAQLLLENKADITQSTTALTLLQSDEPEHSHIKEILMQYKK